MHIHINTHQYTYKHIHAIHTNTFNTYQNNVIHINTQYILIHAIHTKTCNKYQYKPYMPILTINTDTHQYTPIQIQTDICNTYQYMQYKQIQSNTLQNESLKEEICFGSYFRFGRHESKTSCREFYISTHAPRPQHASSLKLYKKK